MKYALAMMLVIGVTGSAIAQSPKFAPTTESLISGPVITDGFTIFQPSGEVLISVSFDGKITYGPHYTPDAAAKLFWETVAHMTPCSKRDSK